MKTTIAPAEPELAGEFTIPPPLTFIKRFDQIGIADIPSVGGKTASLGEMCRELGAQGIRIPPGFAVTAEAYRYYLRQNGLDSRISSLLRGVDGSDVEALRSCGAKIRELILRTALPTDLETEILGAYDNLRTTTDAFAVAVRSSATAEDLPDASFAGAQQTFLNVQGYPALLEACRKCFASLFTDRAISYRIDKGFAHDKVALSIAIQQMVRADLAASGVMFTLDTETGFRDVVLIDAAYGLGENIVQGAVNPDEYYVFKPTLKTGFRSILQKKLGTKELKLVCATGGDDAVINLPVAEADKNRFAISDDEILALARWGCLIEEHYSKVKGRLTPMDIEWARDGITGELFILQARPETVESRKDRQSLETYRLKERGTVLLTGRSVGARIASGTTRLITGAEQLAQFKEGEVLVADKTDPDWEPIMKKAAAIVTNRGGRTCHAAIVSRELGVPAVVGTRTGTEVLRNGQLVTISCAEGDAGKIYQGALPFEISRIDVTDLKRPRTRVMMNVANPDEAFRLSFLPNDGVGLAREEFIITNYIKVHPLAAANYESLGNPTLRAQIDRLSGGYDDKAKFFVDKLAQGVAMIAAAFYPKEVIARLSDFKTNEYANLAGGNTYEPTEENPMLGFRGACRYYHPQYQQGFALECRAMKKVREEMGLTNLKLMIPFCRTVEEGRRVLAEMEKNGLKRGENGLEVYVMCEIPSNVILANEFAGIFDGFSIGSNDLTQLVLGVDRDSEIVSGIFDERNPAVKKMIADVIGVCREKKRKIGICGQAPSDYPEFTRFLIEQHIDSISLNPDTVVNATMQILEEEKAQERQK